MPRPIDKMSRENLHAILDYLNEEAEKAETQEDLQNVMNIARDLIVPTPVQSAVHGLGHLRAEYVHSTSTKASPATSCTVSLEVPYILSTMFHALSERMNRLQDEDPATFSNAASALNWLANGDIQSN